MSGRNHGFLKPKEPEPKPVRWIPHVLRNNFVVDVNIPDEEAAERYGLWEMKAVEDFRHAGQEIKAGDTVTMTGNIAVFTAQYGHAVFTDQAARQEKENRVLDEARKLDMPENIKTLAAFARNEPITLPPFAEPKRFAGKP